MSAEVTRPSRFARLSSLDLMFLHLESPDWPAHFGGLAVVEGGPLLDGSGRLPLREIRERMNRRVANVPHLRRRLHYPRPLGGRAVWIDDHEFDIRHHVFETSVEAPGGDLQLLDVAARLYGTPVDHERPLWELWFLTGLSHSRVGVLLKLHHSVADGVAAVAIMGSLFDLERDAPDPVFVPWIPAPIPGWRSLTADNLSHKIDTLWRAAAMSGHPVRLIRRGRVLVQVAREALGQTRAPPTSLNRVVRSGRRIRFLRLDLAAMKEAAHAHEAKVNDVVLNVWAGGLRELLLLRAEPTSGLELITTVPVSLRTAGAAGIADNRLGIMNLPLPVCEPDAQRRLDLIVRSTRKAKSEQPSAAMSGVLAVASALPGAKSFSAHQQTVNVKVTNVMGPTVPVYVMGARIIDILPITRLFGNVGLSVCAFSYARQIYLVVTADATAFPDLETLMNGMERDWEALIGTRLPNAVPA